MQDVMLDLETLGTRPGCVVLSIGAVFFDRDGLGAEFYTTLRKSLCVRAGLHVDPDTVKWWSRQTPEARLILDSVKSSTALPPRKALAEFNEFLAAGGAQRIWGNGADFDNPILLAVYHAVGVKPAWGPFGNRCYRTAKNQLPGPKLTRQGTHHHALDDAKSQALHFGELLRLHKKVQLA